MYHVLRTYLNLNDYQKDIVKNQVIDDQCTTGFWLTHLKPLVLLDEKLLEARKNLELILYVYAGSALLAGLFATATLAGWGEASGPSLILLVMHGVLLPPVIMLIRLRFKMVGLDLDDRLGWCVVPFLERIHETIPNQMVSLKMDVKGIDWEARLVKACPHNGTYRMPAADLGWLSMELPLENTVLALNVQDHLEGDVEVIRKDFGEEEIYEHATHFENTRIVSVNFTPSPGAAAPENLSSDARVLRKGERTVILYEWKKEEFVAAPELFSTDLIRGVKAVLTGQPAHTLAGRLFNGFSNI